MNKFKGLGVVIAIIGFVMVSAVGVDLVTSRVGLGLIILGLAGLVFAMARLFDFSGDERDWLLGATALGGGYFVWRAFSAGPIGLAIPDITFFDWVLSRVGGESYRICICTRVWG